MLRDGWATVWCRVPKLNSGPILPVITPTRCHWSASVAKPGPRLIQVVFLPLPSRRVPIVAAHTADALVSPAHYRSMGRGVAVLWHLHQLARSYHYTIGAMRTLVVWWGVAIPRRTKRVDLKVAGFGMGVLH